MAKLENMLRVFSISLKSAGRLKKRESSKENIMSIMESKQSEERYDSILKELKELLEMHPTYQVINYFCLTSFS